LAAEPVVVWKHRSDTEAKASYQIRFTLEPRTRIVLDPAPDSWLNYFGEPTGPFRIVLTEHHFAWLSVQCKEMRVTKEDLIFNALLEWTRRTGPAKLPSVGLSSLVFLALEDFIRRHRSEFLPLGGDDKNWSAFRSEGRS
jgi:hypothetical protein